MHPIKQFWKNSAIYGIGSILVRAISFFLLPLYTNAFSKSETGYIFLIFTFIAFAQIVYSFGQDSAFMQFYKQDSIDKDSVGRTSLFLLIITSIIFSTLIIIFSDSIAINILNLEEGMWVIYCSGILFFDAVSSRIMTLIRIKEHALTFLIISILNVIVSLLTSYILVIKYNFGIDGILIGILVGTILRWVMLIPHQMETLTRGIVSFIFAKKLLKFGLPFFPAAFFYLILEISDRYLLFWILGPEAVGVYSIGYKLGSSALFIISAFNLGWQPFYIKIGKHENAGATFGKIGTIFLRSMISLWVLIVFWTPRIMQLRIGDSHLIGEEFWASEQIVSLVFLSYLFYAGYIVLMPSIYILEKQNWSPIFRGTGAIINICLNLLFIKYWGLLGAALATLVAYIGMFAFIFYKSNQWLKILCNWNSIGVHLAASAVFIFIFGMSEKTIPISVGFTIAYLGLLLLFHGKTKLYNDFKYLKSSFSDA
ncbi:MAG: oligosaccharide flippase family protein [Candidatus Marinimicrobia bacterium]|nr:oligosaccharide flippase family protein [Candidatus Neomarinimicrobiota bacterium]